MDDSSPPFQEAQLGATPDIYALHSMQEYRELACRLVSLTRRTLDLITPDLEPPVYDQLPFIDALKRLALQSRVARIRILVQDNSLIRQQGHRLVELAQRLPSTIEIRKPDREFRDFAESFLLADDAGYLQRSLLERYEASACFNDRLKVSQLQEIFTDAWERGEPDRELVRLHL